MTEYNLKNLFYSTKISYIYNLLFGVSTLYGVSWLPGIGIKTYDPMLLIISVCIFTAVGILPTLSYNLIRFNMVQSKELSYGILRYILSTILPFMTPILIYIIALLRGFKPNW